MRRCAQRRAPGGLHRVTAVGLLMAAWLALPAAAQIVAGKPVQLPGAPLTAAPSVAPSPPPQPHPSAPSGTVRELPAQVSPSPGPDLAAACRQLTQRPARLPEGRAFEPIVPTPRPTKAQPLIDPVTQACVVRVTDHAADGVKGFARHDYSRRQAFNADDSRFLVIAGDGHWHLYDARDARHLKRLPVIAGDAEPQWNARQPERLYFLPNNGVGMKLLELDVETEAVRTVADLGARVRALWPTAHAVWTRSEGSPSANQRYWAFQVDTEKWQGLGLVVYDLQEDRLLASYDFARNGKARPDHVSMSPSGDHVVVSWLDGVTALRRDLTQPRLLQRKSEHSDVALTASGQDAYVAVDYDRPGAPVFLFNLHTGERTDLFSTYIEQTATALHFSGKAYAQPGWVLMSTYGDYHNKGGNQPKWLHRKLFAVQLKEDPVILHLAAHQSQAGGYFAEPQASVNRSFTRAIFSSNWGTRSERDIDTFMVMLPTGALARPR